MPERYTVTVGNRLVGRGAELAALRQATGRERGLTLLSGAAGIGKSRLAAELLASVEMLTLEGRAHPLHQGLAYAPIVEALRPAVDLVTDYADLADLGRLLADARLPVAPPLHDPQVERTRMFEATLRLIHRVGPALLFVDDVHWADQGTIDLLHYLSSEIPVLAACRAGEIDLAARNVVELGPLNDAEVAELAHDLLDAEPEPALMQGVMQRANGVPLFVTALLQGDVYNSDVPAVVRDVVLARLERLSHDDRRLLEMIAVAGDSATAPVLSNPDGIERLRTQGLIAEVAGHFRVAHPLYAEVAYSDLTLGERRQLHAVIVEALRQHAPDDILALAPHYLQAGDAVDRAQAGDVLAEAGWRALLINAADEALRYLLAALAAVGPDAWEALSLQDGIGQSYLKLGDIPSAVTWWTQSAESAKRHGEAEKLSALRYRLALMESERGNLAAAEVHALEGSVPIKDTASQNIALRMIYTLRHCQPDRVQLIISQLDVPLGPQAPPAALASEAVRQELSAMQAGDLVRARENAALAVRHGKECHLEWPVLSNFAMHELIGMDALTGDVTSAVANAHQALIMQNTTGISPARSTARMDLNLANYLAGNLTWAEQGSAIGVEVARETRMPRSLARALFARALFLAEQGRLLEAEKCLAEAAEIKVAAEPGLIALRESASTAVALHSGRTSTAPPLTYWALYHEPMTMAIRLLFAWRAGVAQPSQGNGPFLDALATKDADRLDAMGARLFAAQARLERAPDRVRDCIAVFQEAGARPWVDRARQVAREAGIHVPNPRHDGPLTKRETDVVRLVGHGLSNADIAAQLRLSLRTVEAHLTSVYTKLEVSSRLQLARWAATNID